ncbi:MAG: bifunctional (p)ppGpp synthetase/guanosine-3',5'-bis(diphosphate) 3'-pyrophosphohydrolase [Candidatus Melainabacteria bacterium]|jgi:GTP diphosphokinase / guanosine-3',5'-bis(diphosphate) 3'-diphosphatase|nr:bifunctional (p)ppGpp synthetase/guanosine-3',5'-bis(diphosphate) 3'-pyrophosphohydrolase [Candidatus Melainabacteria bacterium]
MQLETLKPELKEELKKCLVSHKHDSEACQLVFKAFDFAFDKHIDQKRKSGQPYIIHPVAVAKTLIELDCDIATICAGLLHDVLEDTECSTIDIKEAFGEVIFQLVDGVTKLGRLNFKSSQEEQANNFRKMLLAIAKDVRVVLVKLADRLHNMQTLEHMPDEKRERIAQETLDIFAPLANRFGLHTLKIELEDLAFKHLHPEEYKKVKFVVNSKKEERETQVQVSKQKIQQILLKNDIKAEVYGRAKHFYSVFRKLRMPGTSIILEDLDQIEVYDLLGIRILVDDIQSCYAVLGLIHKHFRPMSGRFKDYIAVPKANLYQSLHTTVINPYGKPLEVQIRTREMHSIAENGIAAHWHYKEAGSSSKAGQEDLEELTWIRQLLSWQSDVEDAGEYVDTVKKDILSQEVYILSPKGDVFTLPVDSTPIDFAYRVHSKIGDTCTGARVNGSIVSINYKLQNGDLVEVTNSKNSHPNLSWLNFVKTNQAKHKIKSWYKTQNKDRHISIGKQMLEEKHGKEGFEQFHQSKELEEIAARLNYTTTDDLIASIGSGDTTVAQVLHKLQGTKYGDKQEEKLDRFLKIKPRKAATRGEQAEIPELDGLLYNIGKCCMPIPGEAVMGVVSKGKGITIHRHNCHNLTQVETERLMQIQWNLKTGNVYPTNLAIEVVDRVGIVKDILTLVADAGINIADFKVKERPTNNTALLKVIFNVHGQEELNSIITAINNMTDVLSIERL